MTVFDRNELINSLSAMGGVENASLNRQLEAYLRLYGLYDLASRSEYAIGRLELDDSFIMQQSFSHPNQEKVRATVIVVHGYMDHSGLYRHLIVFLYQLGFNVVCFDLSGHGLSDGDPLYIDDFEQYARELDEVVKGVRKINSKPIHLIGQSTGSAVICARSLLLEKPRNNSGKKILLAPLIRPSMWRSIKRRFLLLKYVVSRVPRQFSLSSHDKEFLNFITQQDPLQNKNIPVAWVGAMLRWGDWIEQIRPVQDEISIVQGTSDKTVDWRHNLEVFQRVYPNHHICLVEGARHHLVNESEEFRKPVFSLIEKLLCDEKP